MFFANIPSEVVQTFMYFLLVMWGTAALCYAVWHYMIKAAEDTSVMEIDKDALTHYLLFTRHEESLEIAIPDFCIDQALIDIQRLPENETYQLVIGTTDPEGAVLVTDPLPPQYDPITWSYRGQRSRNS